MNAIAEYHRRETDAEAMLEKYSGMVFGVALSRLKHVQTAEDIMQDVFVRFIRSAPRLDSEEHEKAWFIRATVNCCKSYQLSAWFRHTAAMPDQPPSMNAGDEEAQAVLEALQQLSAPLRQVVHLHYYEGMLTREIAVHLRKSESAIKSTLLRARKKLKEILEVDDDGFF
ncbi:MAG: RNA polymerase sigma factor [Clostridia bacterium]|nr:RNA polymerase sigma factor [Clostridia bacterium]